MTSKVESVLNEALSMSPSERAMVAHCLISSIDEPADENVEQEWLTLARKRLAELESGEVKPVTWDELKRRIRTFEES